MDAVPDNNPGTSRPLAERIVDQSVAFVATAAITDTAIAPSRIVDEGWHALILHTHLYQQLGDRLGRFVHHMPARPGAAGYSPDWLTSTTAAIHAAGWHVDDDLWRHPDDTTIAVAAPAQHSPGPNCGPIVTQPKPKTEPKPRTTVTS